MEGLGRNEEGLACVVVTGRDQQIPRIPAGATRPATDTSRRFPLGHPGQSRTGEGAHFVHQEARLFDHLPDVPVIVWK